MYIVYTCIPSTITVTSPFAEDILRTTLNLFIHVTARNHCFSITIISVMDWCVRIARPSPPEAASVRATAGKSA